MQYKTMALLNILHLGLMLSHRERDVLKFSCRLAHPFMVLRGCQFGTVTVGVHVGHAPDFLSSRSFSFLNGKSS